jgi:hypothetical protein
MSARDIKMGSSPFNESEEIVMNIIVRLIGPVVVAVIAMVLVAVALARLRRIDKGRVKWM